MRGKLFAFATRLKLCRPKLNQLLHMFMRISSFFCFWALISSLLTSLNTQSHISNHNKATRNLHLHFLLSLLHLSLKPFNLSVLLRANDPVAAQVLISLLNSLLDAINLLHAHLLLVHGLFCLILGQSGGHLGILKLRLHVVIFLGQALNLCLMILRILLLLFLEPVHVLSTVDKKLGRFI